MAVLKTPTVALPIPALLDTLCIVTFAAIGRASHHESNPVLDALSTAWPFLAGALIGWVICLFVLRRAPVSVRSSWPIWVCAVAVGMLLRHLVGDGTAASFIVVATVFLGATLMGWRLLLQVLARRRDRVD